MKKKALTFSPLSEVELRKLLSEQNSEEKTISEPETSRKPAGKKKHRKVIAAICACVVLIAGGTAGFHIAQKNHDAVTSEESAAETVPEALGSAVTGDIVNFGAYEWYVIDTTSDSCTLLCKDIVCEKSYHDTDEAITWENCTLRAWLNDEFYNEFTDREKSLIAKTYCNNHSENKDFIDSGNDTEDYIYLLSVEEAESLDKNLLSCSSVWWLRTWGYKGVVVIYNSEIISGGSDVDTECGVRPALTLKFE